MPPEIIVLDGSVALGFLLPDENPASARKAQAMLEDGICGWVPAHWAIEVVNGILMAERRHRLTAAQAETALSLAAKLPVEVDSETRHAAAGATASLARQHRLTGYDAAYLELALRLRAVLATDDADLRKAAKASGVPLLT